jgi:hypothetical protein
MEPVPLFVRCMRRCLLGAGSLLRGPLSPTLFHQCPDLYLAGRFGLTVRVYDVVDTRVYCWALTIL